MEKVYYNKDGWVCKRYPYDIPVRDETRFIEVSEELFQMTFACKRGFSWRVIDGRLSQEVYDKQEADRYEIEKKIDVLKAELEKIKEDIEQEAFGIVRGDYAEKKLRAAEIINELRVLEGKEPRKFV